MADKAANYFRHILRSTGLYILYHLFKFIYHLFDVKLDLPAEPPKPVFLKTPRPWTYKFPRWLLHIIPARSLVHLIPIMASAAVITLNQSHLFLGETFPGIIHDTDIFIALLQIVAKIHELFILSSLANMVFDRIYDDLNSDDGIPLGFLCSGFTFSSINYFWSPDFWGAAIKAKKRQCGTMILLVVTGILALTVGPSVAVLIIPRNQNWDAGGSDFFLRSSVDQLFPKVLNAESLDAPLECLGREAVQYGYCPAGGFNALKNYISQVSMINNGENLQEPLPTKLFGVFSEQYIDVASITRGMPVSKLMGSVRGVACQTAAVGSFLPAVMFQKKLLNDWETIVGNISFGAKTMSTAVYRYYSGAPITTTAINIPAVRTSCSMAQDLLANDSTVSFPVIPELSCPANGQKSRMVTQLQDSMPSTSLRTRWIRLPQNFGDGSNGPNSSASAGLLFEAPWASDNSSRVVIGCTVDARWVKGTVENGRGNPGSFAEASDWGQAADLTTPFRPLANSSWEMITLQEDWLELLTPNLSAQAQTTFDALLATSAMVDGFRDISQAHEWNSPTPGRANRTIYLEWLTTLLVADGLSRYGSHRALNISGPPTTWDLLDYVKTEGDFSGEILRGERALIPPPGTYTTYKTKIIIQGLSYLARANTDYMSMAVLFVYILLAFRHILYLLWFRQSSTAWDSITELVALTLNSRPPLADLANTSAGIYCLNTFGKHFVIRSTAVDPDGPSQEQEAEKLTEEEAPIRHVELVLRDATEITSPGADDNPASRAAEPTSRWQHVLLLIFTWPFTPDRTAYPEQQHELHLHPDLSSSGEPLLPTSSYGKRPSLTREYSSASSSSASPSSSPPSSRKRHVNAGEEDGRVLFEKIMPNQEYA
ncbi:hypothetical protein QBC37DRAFT_281040 [Rhypophila decipiens]|uniref:Uncharacterized protein n=1 Tax=Rhypophila decipiens TaxID=261697 RepID=A0AAN6YBW6_9PEZI|nr:hypothetical protein QBC37DRAFT_281040 [Rhypophila decipiens]